MTRHVNFFCGHCRSTIIIKKDQLLWISFPLRWDRDNEKTALRCVQILADSIKSLMTFELISLLAALNIKRWATAGRRCFTAIGLIPQNKKVAPHKSRLSSPNVALICQFARLSTSEIHRNRVVLLSDFLKAFKRGNTRIKMSRGSMGRQDEAWPCGKWSGTLWKPFLLVIFFYSGVKYKTEIMFSLILGYSSNGKAVLFLRWFGILESPFKNLVVNLWTCLRS